MHHSSDLLLQVCWENTEWFTLIFHQAIEKSNCQWSRRPTCVCVCVHWWSGPRWAALGLNLGVSCRHDNIVLSLMREQINIQIRLMNKREVTSESDLKHSSRKRPTSDCWHKWIQHSPDLYSFVFAFWHLLIFVCFFSDDSASATSSMEVTDRIASLEQRVQMQEDEIQLLKSALADVVRRLNLSEEQQALGSRRGPTKGS